MNLGVLEVQDLFQAHYQALQGGNLSQCQYNSRHEGGAIERIVANGERLALASEDDFLMSNQAGKAHGMNMDSLLIEAA